MKQYGEKILMGVLCFTITLAGCSNHENPLLKPRARVAAKFLVAASQHAEKKLKIFHEPGGHYYGRCMDGEEQQALCSHLYAAMLDYAKTTNNFNKITLGDMTDVLVFKKLAEYYEHERFVAL